MFDAGAMDAQAYAPAEAPRPTPELVTLGRTLFFDPVLASPAEMHSLIANAVTMVKQSAEYRQRFAQTYKVSPDTAVNAYRLRTALATYVRSLTAMNSRFDRAMRGNPSLLRPNERRGFNLFMGKAQCATCHFAPLFNGVAPPTYLSVKWK